jgi:hypothetical protein
MVLLGRVSISLTKTVLLQPHLLHWYADYTSCHWYHRKQLATLFRRFHKPPCFALSSFFAVRSYHAEV